MTILIRDRAQEDKVVKIIEPNNTIDLTFDWAKNDGRLGFIKTNYPNYNGIEINQIHKLYYGNYINSKKQTENVLLKIRQSTNFGKQILDKVEKIRNCNKCPVYDSMESEINDMKNNGGIAP